MIVNSADIAVATKVGPVSIDPDAQSPPAPTGGRLSDHLLRHLERSETVEQLKPYEAGFENLGRTVQEFFRLIGGLIQRVAASPASPGYEPMLIKRGVKPFVARGMAHLFVRRGTRVGSEGKRLLEVAQAIRFLAEPGRQDRAIFRRSKLLLAAWEETSIVGTICHGAGVDAFEFIELLKTFAKGDDFARRRIAEIAAAVAPHLPTLRGRKVGAASAAHEFLLHSLFHMTGSPNGFTWHPYKDEFTDSLTKATQVEFQDPDFDPRPAHRRFKARRVKSF